MLGQLKVRHMTPDFDILSISIVLSTLHILVASGSFRVVLGRELTKTFETLKGLPLGELRAWVESDTNQQRGECVLVVGGWQAPNEDETVDANARRVLSLLLAELPVKRAAALASEITGVRKNLLYQLALQEKDASQ